MPYTTLSGVQLQIPTRGTRNYDQVLLSTTWANIASHDHTGNPKGNQLGGASLLNASVTDAKLRHSVGTSVIGRAGSTTGDVADIVASADNQVLLRSAGTLSWGTIPPASLTTLTASRAVVSDGAGLISASTITSTEVGYLTGLTQNITSLVAQADTWPGTYNIGVRLASGTFTVCGADGNDLSASNPGYVVIGSNANPGRLVRLTITANQSFNDDAFAGTSDIAGEEFGTKAGTAWSNDRPFYLYAVNRDDTAGNMLFGLSPSPSLTSSPSVTGLIGWKLAPSATPSDSSLWLFGSSLTASNYTSRPVIRIGGIRMRKAVTTDDWTVQTLTQEDGIRTSVYDNTVFSWLAGQARDSQASAFFANSGFPTWTTPANITATYVVELNGHVTVWFSTVSAGNVLANGSNASSVEVALPTAAANPSTFAAGNASGLGFTIASIGASTRVGGALIFPPNSDGITRLTTQIDSTAGILNNQFTNAADDLRILGLRYKAFGG